MSPSMNPTDARIDRLYNLLPIACRQGDLQQGSPLQMLLRVIAEQVNLIEDDIAQLYENWFIETCADWVVPYIGDLIGYQPVRSAGEEPDQAVAPVDRILTPRREVANTIGYRRRKGTLALLNDLAFAASGWPARAIEFNRDLDISQNLGHLRDRRGHTLNLRDSAAADLLGSPFDSLSHTLGVRSPNTTNSPGRYNIASLGLFVWRLRAYRATHTLAYCAEEAGEHCYTFSILGHDMPLYTRPAALSSERAPDEVDLPVPIRRRALAGNDHGDPHASEKYYGADKSIAIWVSGWGGASDEVLIPAEKMIPADLSDWRYRPKSGHVAIDPELGRLAFHPGQEPAGEVITSYYYGFSSEIGGGEYARPTLVSAGHPIIYYVGKGEDFPKIHDAYEKWRKEKHPPAIIEICDSAVYEEELRIEIGRDHSLELRAAQGARPVIRLADARAGRPDFITVTGGAGSSFTLDGLLVAGRGIEIKGDLDAFTLRHCTLVPGWGLHQDSRPRRLNEPSLVFFNSAPRVRIEHTIVGPIQVTQENDGVDPLPLQISDSILDATDFESSALGSPERQTAWVSLSVQRSTVLGEIHVHAMSLAENSIFMGPVRVARRQMGCVRFCYVAPASRTPRRFHCQPDLVDQAVRDRARLDALPHEETKGLVRAEQLRVEPAFMSVHYGNPDYCRLSQSCAAELKTGAEDRSELGVFHDLFQPQREANLRARLQEFTPAGIDAGIIFAT